MQSFLGKKGLFWDYFENIVTPVQMLFLPGKDQEFYFHRGGGRNLKKEDTPQNFLSFFGSLWKMPRVYVLFNKSHLHLLTLPPLRHAPLFKKTKQKQNKETGCIYENYQYFINFQYPLQMVGL